MLDKYMTYTPIPMGDGRQPVLNLVGYQVEPAGPLTKCHLLLKKFHNGGKITIRILFFWRNLIFSSPTIDQQRQLRLTEDCKTFNKGV